MFAPAPGSRLGRGLKTLAAQIGLVFGKTIGSILQCGTAGWQVLAPGTAGQVLTSGGAGSLNSWGTDQLAVATNSNAAAGQKGEYVSSQILFASAVSCTNNITGNVTSISLTAGDWDVGANIVVNNSGVNMTNAQGGVTSAGPTSFPDTSLRALGPFGTTFQQFAMPIVTQRFSLSGTTTIYLNQFTQFGAGTTTACGILWARRIR